VNDTLDATDTVETTILVVDDDADMRFLARAVLEGSGIAVAAEAADGAEALAKIAELDPPPVPTVVLLDNQMPGLSGLEVAEQILRQRPGQLIVLFSAYLDAGIVAEATRLGIASCVSKNDAMDLPEILTDLLREHGHR
jgi:two-component system, chemotaxis family, chemotaxis protein CheY